MVTWCLLVWHVPGLKVGSVMYPVPQNVSPVQWILAQVGIALYVEKIQLGTLNTWVLFSVSDEIDYKAFRMGRWRNGSVPAFGKGCICGTPVCY